MDRPAAPPSAPARWPHAIIALHWAMAALVVAALTLAFAREATEARALRASLLEAHRWCGVWIWLGCLLRVLLRWRSAHARPRPAAGWLARQAATLTHLALYALMLAVPLLGAALSSTRGLPLHAFGHELPMPGERDLDLADTLEHWHAIAAYALMALALLHALAAAWHALVRRDEVLASMLPARAGPGRVAAGDTASLASPSKEQTS